MTDNNHTIVINCTQEAAEAILAVINSQQGTQSHVTERKNLAGETAAWIVVATIAGQVLPHVLGVVKEYLSNNRVKKFVVGDIEIENPSPEDIERLWTIIDARGKGD
jgi:hypothetical protein